MNVQLPKVGRLALALELMRSLEAQPKLPVVADDHGQADVLMGEILLACKNMTASFGYFELAHQAGNQLGTHKMMQQLYYGEG
jgi:hypothetical protein